MHSPLAQVASSGPQVIRGGGVGLSSSITLKGHFKHLGLVGFAKAYFLVGIYQEVFGSIFARDWPKQSYAKTYVIHAG